MDDPEGVVAELSKGGTLFLVHQNADPDALGSAVALARAFGGVVGETAGVSASARRLQERLGVEVDPMPHPHKFERVAAVDSSSLVQLGTYARKVKPEDLVLVDHHAYGDLRARARLAFVDATRASCAEVALAAIRMAGRAPDRTAALALATGMVADSQRFRHGDLDTLRAFIEVAEPHGLTVRDCLAVLEDDEPGEDLPRRIANLKAASRVAVEHHSDLLLARSEVSAFEASAANGLVRLGADLAVVASEKGSRGRVSARGSQALLDRGVHLGEVVNAVARAMGWSGGGHESAAGLNGPPPAAPVAAAVAEAVAARVTAAKTAGKG